jgi:hypothetical protein
MAVPEPGSPNQKNVNGDPEGTSTGMMRLASVLTPPVSVRRKNELKTVMRGPLRFRVGLKKSTFEAVMKRVSSAPASSRALTANR